MAWVRVLTVGRATDMLLGPDDPAPFDLFNAEGASPFLLIGDHAGSAIPRALGTLGLEDADLERHIALDIGVRDMGQELAQRLDAPFLHQIYSRLVIDCNRDPAGAEAIATESDGSRIVGNEGLDHGARQARITDIHASYHAAIEALLDARLAIGRDTILLSLHSFTPVMNGIARPWHIGILHWRGRTEYARGMLAALTEEADITVGDNVPYAMDDTDYTVPCHAFPRHLPYAEIEVRQDLIGTHAGQVAWAKRIATSCRTAASL